MYPYLPHLLADIKAAHRQEIPLAQEQLQTFEEEMEEIEKWVSGEEAEHTFGYYCGLESKNFPPPDQLKGRKGLRMILLQKGKMMGYHFEY